jgi:hypothetical protein
MISENYYLMHLWAASFQQFNRKTNQCLNAGPFNHLTGMLSAIISKLQVTTGIPAPYQLLPNRRLLKQQKAVNHVQVFGIQNRNGLSTNTGRYTAHQYVQVHGNRENYYLPGDCNGN